MIEHILNEHDGEGNTRWIDSLIERYRQEIDETNGQRNAAGYGSMDAISWVAFFHPEEMEDRELT